MTNRSIPAIVADLTQCLSRLEAAQVALAKVRSLSDDFLDGCLELGLEQSVARGESLIENLTAVGERMDQARTRTTEIIAQTEEIGRDAGAVTGKSAVDRMIGSRSGLP